MALAAPNGYVDLYSAVNRQNTDLNIIGVVTDCLPATLSRGTDWMCTFSLADSRVGGYGEGLKVRFFRPRESELPAIRGTGDVVVLRNVKSKIWSGMTVIMSGWASSWIVFPASSIPEKPPPNCVQLKYIKDVRAPVPTSAEMLYAISLCNAQDRNTFTAPAEPRATLIPTTEPSLSGSNSRQKFSVVKDVVIDKFYDLVGQVVKIFPNNGRTELYITDYTSNTLLYNYEWGREGEDGVPKEGDPHGYLPRASGKKWRGPFGKMTLMVTLWPPHSYFAETNVKEDDFVFLRNVRIKYSGDVKLEGGLHTDRRDSDRIDVNILKDCSDDRVKDVLRRKKEYGKNFKQQSEELIAEARGQKRKAGEEGENLSKAQARKRRKQLREREQQERQRQQRQSNDENDNNQKGDQNAGPPVILKRKIELNQNVQCTHPSVRPRSLSSILSRDQSHCTSTPAGRTYTLPFQNICSRATVRVVGFFPPRLEDFAVRYKVSEYDVLSDESGSESENSSSSSEDDQSRNAGDHNGKRDTQWAWRFCLLLEDASPGARKGEQRERMKVYVADNDAQFLLKMDAEDLRKNYQALAMLREKLFILWGDLEEKKTREMALKEKNTNPRLRSTRDHGGDSEALNEAPKARPFQCCIKEYGVRSMPLPGEESGCDNDRDIYGWERRFRMFGATIL